MISEWLLFALLTIDVPELKMGRLNFSLRKREQYTEVLNESSAESLMKLLPFKGKLWSLDLLAHDDFSF